MGLSTIHYSPKITRNPLIHKRNLEKYLKSSKINKYVGHIYTKETWAAPGRVWTELHLDMTALQRLEPEGVFTTRT
jgi:hypothetical protein